VGERLNRRFAKWDAANQATMERHNRRTGLIPHRLGAQRGEIALAVREHPQDRSVIIGDDGSEPSAAQRRDRRRQRVVRVVLRGAARAEHAHPRRERRGDVDHVLAGADELLRQQVAEPSRGLDRPPPIRERLGPCQQLLALRAGRSDLELSDGDLVTVDRDRGVPPLVRVNADQHHHECASR